MDCLHLQLYRDSKDRYKQGQTKASLSLQHFLAVESGFTLDKESNTIAIICQDVTVVLAFDTRERLIQWQVKIANNLGEDQQFLIQISSAPPRTKIATGPARLHVQEHRFCLAQGVPPRLIGFWQISQLRKYGVVENRFCFEGGSRCGRGEGVYVLVTDQGEEICRVLTLAAEGKLTSRRTSRSASRNASVCESPRKQRGNSESRFLTDLCTGGGGAADDGSGGGSSTLCGCPSCRQSAAAGGGDSGDTVWPSAETSCCDYGDTTSVAEFNDKQDGRGGGAWGNERSLERCMSCISKLGAMSRSSTGCTANTPSAAFTPAWTMEANQATMNCQQSLQEISSTNCSSTLTSDDYSVPNPLPQTHTDESRIPSTCQFCPMPLAAPPSRPPKPSQLGLAGGTVAGGGDTSSPLKKKQKKPPMPLPTPQQPPTMHQHHHYHHHFAESSQSVPHHPSVQSNNAFDNYDFPKLHLGGYKDDLETDDYYDTPKNIKESLEMSTSVEHNYGNYDTPPHPAALPVQPLHACNRNLLDNDARRAVVCPCHRMFGWAENWMFLPYCRRGNGIENTSLPFHKVKLDGEGRMPVVNKSGEVAIYATVNKLKKTKCLENKRQVPEANNEPVTLSVTEIASSNYVNVETGADGDPGVGVGSSAAVVNNYANLEFAQSLEYYENVRDLARRPPGGSTCNQLTGCTFCLKCGHPCKVSAAVVADRVTMTQNTGEKRPQPAQDDYLMMEPAKNDGKKLESCSGADSKSSSNFPGYLPMLPISQVGSTSTITPSQPNKMTSQLVEKAASVPSLLSAGRFRRQNDHLEISSRVPGSAMMGVNQLSQSATSSPYLRRNLMSYSMMEEEDASSRFVRKRSSSADSTRYIDNNLESITERTVSSSSSTQVNNSKNTSVDSLSSQNAGDRDVTTPVNMEEGDEGERVVEGDEEVKEDERLKSDDSLRTLVQECFPQASFAPVHIRRSSSIPCKSGHNRDSSSSNDSGVSIASLKHRGADFAEFELPLTTSKSSRRHFAAVGGQRQHFYAAASLGNCLHASLPRRSKSSDPLQELTFQFQKTSVPAKSSSAEAEVPVYSVKRDALRGCVSPAGDIVLAAAYLDSRSTSSGTSDMSDYFETLSLSSYSSSDTPDSLRLGRPAATTLRPRSGKEYHKIDRCGLEVTDANAATALVKKPAFGPITTVLEKTETLPPDCSN